ncbi:MAG: EAL domain-containing protein [Pseudomonadales bacterium]
MPLLRMLRIATWLLLGAALMVVLGVFAGPLWWVAALVLTLLTAGGLRSVRQALAPLLQQAAGLQRGSLEALIEPAAPDVATLVRSFNGLVERLGTVLDEELSQFDHLLRLTHHDPLTGLLTREHFIARTRSLLDREDIPGAGLFVICRLPDLQRLNRDHGWAVVDILIRRFARGVATLPFACEERLVGRLNGSEVGLLLLPGLADDALLPLFGLFDQIVEELELSPDCALRIAGTRCFADEPTAVILTRADAAMARLLSTGRWETQIVSHGGDLPEQDAALAAVLREVAAGSATPERLKIVGLPVAAPSACLFEECRLRLREGPDTPWSSARGALLHLDSDTRVALDRVLVGLALDHAAARGTPVAVGLSPQSLTDGPLDSLLRQLESVPSRASRLWLEVPESALTQHGSGFQRLGARARPLGCRVGISHFGTQARLGQLSDIRFDYLKIDAALVAGVHQRAGNQILLRALLTFAHAVGVLAVADGATEDAERATLFELGFDGVAGPAAARPGSVLTR